MPDTSSAAYRAHTETWRVHGDLAEPCPAPRRDRTPTLLSGVDPIDQTWFDAAECPVDTPLVLLIPTQR